MQNLWLWGSKETLSGDKWSEQDRSTVFDGEMGRSGKPIMCKWFRDQGIKILEIASGYQFVVCKTESRDNELAFYVLTFNNEYDFYYGGASNLKSVYETFIF